MRNITIRTTQNVSIEYELSGSLPRVFAFLIDMLIVFGVYLLLGFLVIFNLNWPEMFVLFFSPLLIFFIYYYFFEMLGQGQTPGKRIQQIRVLRADGKDPTPGDFLLRTLFLLPDAWFSLGIPAILLINTTPKAQRLGDLAAGTVVVKNRSSRSFLLSDIQSIKTRADHVPSFPGIQRFSEADMLLIKSSLKRLDEYRNPAHQEVVDELAATCRFKLEIEDDGLSSQDLLKVLLQDYIVLTR
ncbi:hypothetical protein CEQ90_07190 [Lewinellaceae bacterium SD302]|nr:hypothetical protein CEQ90_07190 [Lewinellaceae bacterium SD302]